MQTRHLGELNTSNFFCKGCGIAPVSDQPCSTCGQLVKAADGLELPVGFWIVIALALIAIAAGAWAAMKV